MEHYLQLFHFGPGAARSASTLRGPSWKGAGSRQEAEAGGESLGQSQSTAITLLFAPLIGPLQSIGIPNLLENWCFLKGLQD